MQNRSGHNENVLPDRLSSDENGGLIQKQQNRIVCLLIVGALRWRLETPHLSGGVTLKFCCLHGRVKQSGFCEKRLGGGSLGTGLSLSSHNSDEEFLAKHLNVSTTTLECWTYVECFSTFRRPK